MVSNIPRIASPRRGLVCRSVNHSSTLEGVDVRPDPPLASIATSIKLKTTTRIAATPPILMRFLQGESTIVEVLMSSLFNIFRLRLVFFNVFLNISLGQIYS